MSLKLRGCCTQRSSGLKVNVFSWIGGILPWLSLKGQEELRSVGKNFWAPSASLGDEFF